MKAFIIAAFILPAAISAARFVSICPKVAGDSTSGHVTAADVTAQCNADADTFCTDLTTHESPELHMLNHGGVYCLPGYPHCFYQCMENGDMFVKDLPKTESGGSLQWQERYALSDCAAGFMTRGSVTCAQCMKSKFVKRDECPADV